MARFPRRPRRIYLPTLLSILCAIQVTEPRAASDGERLGELTIAECRSPSPDIAAMARRIPGASPVSEQEIRARGTVIGWNRQIRLLNGDSIHIERIAPGGRAQRVIGEYLQGTEDTEPIPVLAVVVGTDCERVAGRRLLYEPGATSAHEIEFLDHTLQPTGRRELLNPAVPAGDDPGGVPVALVDAGINYLIPSISQRLARDADGIILGYDFWDLDARPFDANPARSPFFPQRHGTQTASLLLREAPDARLVPYRYPRTDMTRMAALIKDAAAKGVRIVNMSLGSNDHDEWQAFVAAARDHPEMLFIVSAGNNGRNIDHEPVYPASIALDNILTVTSSERTGALARGSNFGSESVDLLVPGEGLIVTGFDGEETLVYGSSYANVRISALAARLLAANPSWKGPELKAAIVARSLTLLHDDSRYVAHGYIPRPDKADRLLPVRETRAARVLTHSMLDARELYAQQPTRTRVGGFTLDLSFAYFESTEWSIDDLHLYGRQAADILAQCNIHITTIEFYQLQAGDEFLYFQDAIAQELIRQVALPTPTVYFDRDTVQEIAFEAEAIGRGNSGTRTSMRDTVWIIEEARDPAIIVAHELVHVLMDSGHHVELPGNLMRAETAPSNTRLTADQCDTMIRTGTDNGLLKPIRG